MTFAPEVPPAARGARALCVLGALGVSCVLATVAAACGDDPAPVRETSSPMPPTETATPEPVPTPEPPGAPLPERQATVALGGVHTCDLDDEGAVRCWGGDQFGQLGDDEVERDYEIQRSLPGPIDGALRGRALYVGNFHSCTLGDEHAVNCWGHDGFGQIDGAAPSATAGAGPARADAPTPRALDAFERPVELALGRQHTCARLADGTVACLGDNSWGQLGDGTLEARRGPVAVDGLTDVTAIAAGRDHSCALTDGGEVWCWGAAVDGQLGAGAARVAASGTPIAIEEVPEGVTAIAAGGLHSCLLASGVVHCWGANDAHQIGNGRGGEQDDRELRPARVLELEGVQEIVVGGRHSCARGAGGAVHCWGANHFGQIGDGTNQGRSRPEPVRGLEGAIQVALGTRHSCARRGDGSTVCWGANRLGQLGDGTEDKISVGVLVGGGGRIAEPDEEPSRGRRRGGMASAMNAAPGMALGPAPVPTPAPAAAVE